MFSYVLTAIEKHITCELFITIMKQKRVITEDFFVGNLGTPEAPQSIVDCCPDTLRYDEATVAYNEIPEHIYRKWLSNSRRS